MTGEQRRAVERYKEAKRELDAALRRRDNYDGNNPNKYVGAVRYARQQYTLASEALGVHGLDSNAVDGEIEQEHGPKERSVNGSAADLPRITVNRPHREA